jgi:hypothetical protein
MKALLGAGRCVYCLVLYLVIPRSILHIHNLQQPVTGSSSCAAVAAC